MQLAISKSTVNLGANGEKLKPSSELIELKTYSQKAALQKLLDEIKAKSN